MQAYALTISLLGCSGSEEEKSEDKEVAEHVYRGNKLEAGLDWGIGVESERNEIGGGAPGNLHLYKIRG